MRVTMLIVMMFAAFACGGSPRASQPAPAPPPPSTPVILRYMPTVVLTDALAAGSIAIRPHGAGVNQLALEVVAHADVELVVPTGTFFRGKPEGRFQNMITTHAVTVQLTAGRTHAVMLPAACANFRRSVPGPGDRFELADADPALHRLVTCLDERGVRDSQTQTLVWRLTDDIKRDDLVRRRDMLRPSLVVACQTRLRQSVERCQRLVDAAYEATVDKLLEHREPDCDAELVPLRGA
ncbi:MAG: hypothetical protein H0T89_35080 [Deltaproteobacteria bacterium]|nr:hypothetical protein [Deltaproteobacteria bacterium]MDQ3296132.1 hypothetical protein [Myxococcota bacterium]